MRYRGRGAVLPTRYTPDHAERNFASASEASSARRKHVIGPDGRRLTVADLPSPDTKRWVVRRKAQVVAAVRCGLLSLEQACSRYKLNFEEFQSWQRCIDCFGVEGLRTTWTQFYLNLGSSERWFIHEPEVEAARPRTIMTSALRIQVRPRSLLLRSKKKTSARGVQDRGGC
jgi:hypothetical protein